MIKFIEPNKILTRFIQNFCVVETNNSVDFLPSERVFPTGSACVVFHYGNPSKFKQKSSIEYIEPNLVICGPQTDYYDLSMSAKTGMVLITFKPQGLSAFFNLPAKELLNENIPLNSLINNEASVLEDKLLNSKNSKQKIAHLESFFTERLIFNRDFDRIDYAIKLIENYKGQIKTQQLSQEVCIGIKQFERIFSSHVGMNPKKFSSIIRFQNVLEMKRKFKELTMYQLAFDSGYYDQSHFIHDFKNLTGLAPKFFFNNML